MPLPWTPSYFGWGSLDDEDNDALQKCQMGALHTGMCLKLLVGRGAVLVKRHSNADLLAAVVPANKCAIGSCRCSAAGYSNGSCCVLGQWPAECDLGTGSGHFQLN